MSQSENLLRVRERIDLVLLTRNEGTVDYPRKVARIDTAHQRAMDRAGGGNVPHGEPDLTDDDSMIVPDPEAAEERRNQDRVKRQAEKDAWKIQTLIGRMATDAKELAEIVDRQAEVVHESKLPTDVLPGCRSCARKEDANGATLGGQWAPVDTKGTAPADGLCRACYEFKLATGGIPPILWCDIRHRQGAKAANRWLAKEYPKLLDSVQRKAKQKGITADDLALSDGLMVSQPNGTVAA